MINYLLSNRTTRDFLNNFPEKKWNQIILNTLIIGIENLKQNHNIVTLTSDDIKMIASKMKKGIESNKPNLYQNDLDYQQYQKEINHFNKNDQYDNLIQNHMSSSNIPFKNNINNQYSSNMTNMIKNDDKINLYLENPRNIVNNNDRFNYFDNNDLNNFNSNNPNHKMVNNNNRNFGQTEFKVRAKTPNINTRNKRCTNSVGMLNSIYPDWWATQENNEYEDNEYIEKDDEEFDELSTLKNAKNKHFSHKLSLQEKKALIGKSRRDNGESSSGGRSYSTGYTRGRSLGINTRDRINDRPEKIDVSFKIY